MRGISPYFAVIGIFLLALLGGATVLAYLYFFDSFRIAKSPIIKNETLLKQYLGVTEIFPKPISGIRLLSFVPQKNFKETDDCISDKPGPILVFCFDEIIKNGKMTINIYPNAAAISERKSGEVNKLLNLNLVSDSRKQIRNRQQQEIDNIGHSRRGGDIQMVRKFLSLFLLILIIILFFLFPKIGVCDEEGLC